MDSVAWKLDHWVKAGQDATHKKHQKSFFKFLLDHDARPSGALTIRLGDAKGMLDKGFAALLRKGSAADKRDEIVSGILDDFTLSDGDGDVPGSGGHKFHRKFIQFDSESGSFSLAFKKDGDANELRSAFDRATRLISLVRQTQSESCEDFVSTSIQLEDAKTFGAAAKAPMQSLQETKDAWRAEQDLYVCLTRDNQFQMPCDKHEREWLSLVEATTDFQLAFVSLQERQQMVKRSQSANPAPTKLDAMRDKVRWLALSFFGTEDVPGGNQPPSAGGPLVDQAVVAAVNQGFVGLVKSWTSLLQSYYQHILDQLYHKKSAPSQSADGLEDHWKSQMAKVTKLLQVWQDILQVDSKGNAGAGSDGGKSQKQLEFEVIYKHITELRREFTQWLTEDARLKHETPQKVQIVEIDSDDSDSESGEDGAGANPKVDDAVKVPRSMEGLKGYIEEVENGLGWYCDESKREETRKEFLKKKLKVNQVGLALLLDALFGKVYEDFLRVDADRVMNGLLLSEQQASKKKSKKKEKEKERRSARGNQELAKDELDNNDDIGDVEINEMFKNATVFECLSLDGAKGAPQHHQPKSKAKQGSDKAKSKGDSKADRKKSTTSKNTLSVLQNRLEMRMKGYVDDSGSRGKGSRDTDKVREGKRERKRNTGNALFRVDANQVGNRAKVKPVTKKKESIEAAKATSKVAPAPAPARAPARLRKEMLTEDEVHERIAYEIGETQQQRENRLQAFPALDQSQDDSSLRMTESVLGHHRGSTRSKRNILPKQQMDTSIDRGIAGCEQRYRRARERAQAAYEACTVNATSNTTAAFAASVGEILTQRLKVLEYAVEDSKANTALAELKLARESLSGGSARGKKHLEDDLTDARDKLAQAQDQCAMFVAMTKHGEP